MPPEEEREIALLNREKKMNDTHSLDCDNNDATNRLAKTQLPPEPTWLRNEREQSSDLWGEPLIVPEWPLPNDDTEALRYRSQNGWHGRDLMHDINSSVRIVEYFVQYGNDAEGLPRGYSDQGGVGTQLTGIVLFTPRAESHMGYCHGGSMCSVLDDVIGWCGFVATGKCRPWSGFTVQINTQLQKPISCQNTYLLVKAQVTKIERRKVYIQAKIVGCSTTSHTTTDSKKKMDNGEENQEIVHASGDGLVVLNKGILPELATRGSLHSWPSSVEIT